MRMGSLEVNIRLPYEHSKTEVMGRDHVRVGSDPNWLGCPLHLCSAFVLVCVMPHSDARTLSDVREPTLTIVCHPCARRGRYAVARLIEKHGDAKLPELLHQACPMPKSAIGERL
jgi:hypothetical protein